MAIGLLCCRLAMVAFIIPYVFIYHPGLLLIGSAEAIALDLGSATLAVIALVAAAEGYLFVPLSPLMRALFGIAGLLLITTRMIPASLGLALLIGLSLWLWSGRGLVRWGGTKV
jgi:TRAP-type uncharacterized transport system fused permease subunit